MHRNQDRHTAHLMLGFAAGAAAGALAGLLLAPKSGAELRREARDSASRARGAVADKYGTAKQAVTDVVDRGRRALNVGRETYNEARTSHRVTG
jgi:gas vesicle protein